MIVQEIPQDFGSLPLLEEFDGPVYDQIHQEQVVAGMATRHRVENQSVQEQVIVQEIPHVPTVERTQEQIVDITGLVNPQFSSTAVEASAPQVVVSLPPFDDRSLQERRPRILWKSQSCKNK